MSSIDSGQMSSEERPVELRARRDVELTEAWYQSERSWIVKDPLALQYYRLRAPEHLVFSMLDGLTSLKQIQQSLTRQFPDRITRLADVQQLISSLNQQGLLVSITPGKAGSLLERAGKIQRQKAVKLLSSALSLRLPGVDPTRLLDRLYPRTKWMFSRWFTLLAAIVSLAAVALIFANLDEFLRRLPEFQQFFALQNILAIGGLLIVTKTIHELGHALFCKHYGGECHEIGFMFLVLMPAMYCDTSDSWKLPNKWHRMAIGAAGMYVEVLMAAVFTFVWWYTNPGWLHYLSLNVMFLCSVSTLLFNGNPLLRYDGYYILSDLLEVPNMSQKSRSAMLSKLRVTLLGMEPIPERQLPQQHRLLFAIYSLLSVVYRWFVLIMILWLLSEMFEPYGLQAVGHFLIGLSLVGLIGVPIWKLVKFFSYPGKFRQVKKTKLMTSLVFASGLLAVVFLYPFAYDIDAHLVIQPADARRVHVSIPGILVDAKVQPGQSVQEGDVLARLHNANELVRVQQLKGRVAILEREIARLNQLTSITPLATTAVIARQTELRGTRQQLELQQKRAAMLEVKATQKGVVYPPPNIPESRPTDPSELALWSGTPFDQTTEGAYLEKDTWFCSISDGNHWQAELMIDQSDIALINSGDPVRIMLDEWPGRWIQGKLTEVSEEPVQQIPRELTAIAGGPLSSASESTGEKALFDYYQANALIDSVDVDIAPGFRGRGKIRVGKFTLAWRISRFFKTVFNFS